MSDRRSDDGTEKALRSLERRVKSVYTTAQKDLQNKLDTFTERFKKKDAEQQKALKEGKITEQQYKNWLAGQVFQGKQWRAKVDQMTTAISNANVIAQKIINNELNGVFANSANWQSYQLEHTAGLNFGFTLYDKDTVARLIQEEPKLLPKAKISIPKDKIWNHKLITQQITQGILQGENINTIAKRMSTVTDRDKNLCLTRARTAMTGAQNAGRQESLQRAQTVGLKVKKEWMATLDGHTRTNHSRLDGQKVDIDKPFHIGSYTIRYPGDRAAAPAMVYNCRCTMVGDLEDYPDLDAERYDNIDGQKIRDMSFNQWKAAKSGKPVENPVEKVEKVGSSDYEPYKFGQITKREAGILYRAYKQKDVKVLPETTKVFYDEVDLQLRFADERYRQDQLYYDRMYDIVGFILQGDYEKAQKKIKEWEKDMIERAGKRSWFYKYKKKPQE